MNPLFTIIISSGGEQFELNPRPRTLSDATFRAMNVRAIARPYFWEVYEITQMGLLKKQLSGHVNDRP